MKEVRIGLIGAGWMGKAHASAYKNVPLVFGVEPAVPALEMIADLNGAWAEAGARDLGFRRWTDNWRDVVNDRNVDVIDITTPNNVHAEIAIAALEAGKPVYCEKPLALTAGETARMVEAAKVSRQTTLVGFNYLKNPAQGYARDLIRSGEIGDIIQFRGSFDQDFMTDPDVPFSWRHERAIAGAGALGDMASHSMSLSQFLVGDVVEVCGMAETYIKQRAVAGGGSGHTAQAGSGEMRDVENDDISQFIFRYENGGIGYITSSRLGTGRKLGLDYEIQGTKGALTFTQERMNELRLYRHAEPRAERGYKTIFIGPDHPGYAGFHPIPGIGLGYNDQKIIEAHDLIVAIATGQPAEPDFAFGHRVAVLQDAVLRSIAERRWVRVDEVGGT